MSGVWNPQLHSKKKLGHALTMPVVPTKPVRGQVNPRALHLALTEDGAYVTMSSDVVPPTRSKEVREALAKLKETKQVETSYSGSDSAYYPLTVHDVEGRPDIVELQLGDTGVVFCRAVIDPTMELISTDEPIDTGDGDGDN